MAAIAKPVVRGAKISLRDITKTFGATRALDGINLDIEPGEIHALVGENGAGKSTLGKVIGGIYSADAGQLLVDDAVVERWDAPTALRARIATIQQELSLVPGLSVAKNVFLGMEPARFGLLRGSLRARYQELDRTVGFGIDPDVPLGLLRIADQQKVEILRAVARDARLIVMDEPTSSLTRNEADRLHEIMDRLSDEGRTIIYVSHFLDEVLKWADRVSVMRDGALVRTGLAADETKASLVEAMLGQPLETAIPPRHEVAPDAPVVLDVRGVTGAGVHDADIHVRAGEIVGLAGLVGSGRTELARLLFGAEALQAGEIRLNGKLLPALDPRGCIDAGIVMLPEDRRGQGLVMTQNVRENVTLPRLRSFATAGRVSRKAERRATAGAIERLGIVPARIDGDLQFYSGGNQQKALFAKWTSHSPQIVILDEPTRGVDIGAKVRIYEAIVEVASGGAAVILISSELEEVLELSHRAYLVSGGRIVDEVNPSEHTVDSVLRRLFGADSSEEPT